MGVDGHGAHVGLVGLEEDRAFAIGRHFVNLALAVGQSAGGHQQIALAIEGQRPDVFCLGIVEDFRFAGASHAIDLAVGRGSEVDAVLGIDGDGVDFEGVDFGHHFAGAAGWNPVQLGARAAGGVEVALGILSESPEVGRRGIEQFA